MNQKSHDGSMVTGVIGQAIGAQTRARRWNALNKLRERYVNGRMKIRLVWGALVLLGGMLDVHAGEQGPPATASRWGTVVFEKDSVRVSLRPVTDRAWQEAPAESRIEWDEWSLYWRVRRDHQSPDLIAPLVPLSSIQVSIENLGVEPLRFAEANVTVEDDHDRFWPIASEAQQYLPVVVDEVVARVPELSSQGPRLGSPRHGDWPAAIQAMALAVPLLGPGIEVQPGGRWTGALVLLDGAASPEDLVLRSRSSLRVSFSGIRSGDRVLEPWLAVLPLEHSGHVVCSDGQRVASPDACGDPEEYFPKWTADGPCIQRSIERVALPLRLPTRGGVYNDDGTVRRLWIGGTSIHNADLAQALLNTSASQPAIERARRLRVAGWTLVGAGMFGAASTAAALSANGYDKEAPAGLGVVAVAGVGALLLYLSKRDERAALRSFNRQAFESGSCVVPK